MFKELKDKARFEQIRTLPEYASLRKEHEEAYEDLFSEDKSTYISFELETEILRNGNRTHFEEIYFLRRRRLSIAAIMTAIYPDNPRYLKALEETICEICNEYSWQLPAHRPKPKWNRKDDIDLFAAETGLYLAEIKYMLSDVLNPFLADRIEKELEWRILKSFENDTFWWEELKSNWASVCSGSVGTVFLYECPERFEKISHRISACMDNYLKGIKDEGSTSEGASYWSYGFSFFVMYHDLLRRFTGGEQDAFKNEKVARLAAFPSNLYLDEDTVVLFSDAGSGTPMRYMRWLVAYLNNEYGIELPIGRTYSGVLNKFSMAIRNLLNCDKECKFELKASDKVFYSELQWYMDRNPRYSIAVKAGNNDEEHNHNDIGSFMVIHNKQMILSELGAGEYTADYCGDNRYTCLEPSAEGHSIPIINGTFQQFGSEYYGTMEIKDNTASIDMKNAYPVDISSFTRKFEMLEEKVVLTDTFDSDLDVKERFITEIEPVIEDGNIVKIAGAKLCVPSFWTVSVSSEIRNRHGGKTKRKIFILDFSTDETTDNFKMEITFE